jgi:hypothetical protein
MAAPGALATFLRLDRLSGFHPIAEVRLGHEADSGTAAEIYAMRFPKAISEFQLQLA